MSVGAYDPCPCGSGEKLKWCCDRIAKFAERATEHLRDERFRPAIEAAAEGLRLDPNNVWLRTITASALLHSEQYDDAESFIASLSKERPDLVQVWTLRAELELRRDRRACIHCVQRVAELATAEQQLMVGRWFLELASSLQHDSGFAALAHLRAALAIEVKRCGRANTGPNTVSDFIATLESGSDLPWIKEEYRLLAVPTDAGDTSQAWQRGLDAAGRYCWEKASAEFKSVTTTRPDLNDAWFNLAVCLASVDDAVAAADSLVRFAQQEPNADRAIEALALAQSIDDRPSTQTVPIERIEYELCDKVEAVRRLSNHVRFLPGDASAPVTEDSIHEFGIVNSEPREVDHYQAFCRTGHLALAANSLHVMLYDTPPGDDRQQLVEDVLASCLRTESKRSAIELQPRSQAAGMLSFVIRLSSNSGAAHADASRLLTRCTHDNWMDTPSGWLGDKTPREAAAVESLKPMLRATQWVFESSLGRIAFNGRTELGIPDEPTYVVAPGDVDKIPVCRLCCVDVKALSESDLQAFAARAQRFGGTSTLDAAMLEAWSRTDCDIEFRTLAGQHFVTAALQQQDRAGAEDALRRCRELRPGALWDVYDWMIATRFEPPENWVLRVEPLIASVVNDQRAITMLLTVLSSMGLVRIRDDRDRIQIDMTPLRQFVQSLASQGRVATRAEEHSIWTPGAAASQAPVWSPDTKPTTKGGGIWTPG